MSDGQNVVCGSSSASTSPPESQPPASSRNAGKKAPDAFTILKSIAGTASKRFEAQPDGTIAVKGFNAGRHCYVFNAPVSGISSLSAMLKMVEARRDCMVIRGAARPDLDLDRPQLRRKTHFQTPPAGRSWILIDVDKVPLPPGLSLQRDVAAVCEHLVGRLPAEFHQASYHWQLSSSAGITDSSVVSLHLWFWLDRPVTDTQLKAWSTYWNAEVGIKLIDPALFNDVQAHFTAAPVFVGLDDPFPVRSGLVRKAIDEVALKLPRPRKAHSARVGRPPLQSGGGFEVLLGQVGDHPGGRGFHKPLLSAVASYVATRGHEATNIEALYEVVRATVLAADRSNHDDNYVEEMASRAHVIRAIEGAIAKFGVPSPRRKSRQIPGVRPYFTSKPVSAAEGSAMLKRAVDGFFRPFS